MKGSEHDTTDVIKDITPKERITNALLLNASFINNIGLMHGKMGISIYFYRLARETKNKIYEDYAGELIDEIYEEITNSTPWNFENGLAGIGWGIEYLVQNGFIEADTDEVLEEFDNRIFRQLIYSTPAKIGLLNGLLGIGFYLLKRIQNAASNDDNIKTLTNKQTLIHLIDELERRINEMFRVSGSLFQVHQNPEQEILNPEQGTATRDYPILLWFLAELHEQNIFNFKVEKLITRLIEPLTEESNFPVLQSNRLLLALATLKFQNVKWTSPLEERGVSDSIKEISATMLAGINRNIIKSELTPGDATIKTGTSGIAYVYLLLYELTGNDAIKQEAEYWSEQTFSFEETDNGFAGFDLKNETKAFGLLEGIAGIGMITNINNYTLSFPPWD